MEKISSDGLLADSKDAITQLKAYYEKQANVFKEEVKTASNVLTNLFTFSEEVFSEGQEMLILLTELTTNCYTSSFISKYGCKEYFNHSKELSFYDRSNQILDKISNLGDISNYKNWL